MDPVHPRSTFPYGASHNTRVQLCLSALLIILAVNSHAATTTNAPIDWRHRISAADFQQTATGEWTSPTVRPAFAFNELIYSWHVHQPGDTFRLYLKTIFRPGDETDWLYAGYWGDVKEAVTNRQLPTFERGVLDMDWLKLKTKAEGVRFKVVSAGEQPLEIPPALTIVATDTHPTKEAVSPSPKAKELKGRVLDVPLRRQLNTQGQWMKDRCQSAALASAMDYYGTSVPLEDIVRYTNDPEYDYPGIWPRVIAAAQEFGIEAYIERFRDWTAVRETLGENKVILCSMRMAEGDCKAPPYRFMGNHIVALCGVTDDGRAVVTDSALGKSGRGYLCQWLQSDFETVWMRTKGGVAMVICPPKGATERLVKDLPPFPSDRVLPTGDDH